jgi:peroxiredoxin
VAAISTDPPETLRDHVAKTGWTYSLLSDAKTEAIRSYALVHAGQGPNGTDIPRPAELLIDPSGTIRWVDLTDDYRVRTRPETVLEAFDRLSGQ